MWGVTPSDRWDWAALRANIAEHGLRNSLLVAPMPTASTSQILGNNEGTDPYTSNIYTRRILAGDFIVVNDHLVRDLTELGLWTPAMKDRIIGDGGSVANITEIPEHIRELYKTAWEISQRVTIDMAADRAFVCQSQSMNLYMATPDFGKLTSAHFYGWRKGLKTGMYYLHTRPAANAIQFTLDREHVPVAKTQEPSTVKQAPLPEVCYPGCDSCSA
jgi:ribonucleotide reductase alpha subunit